MEFLKEQDINLLSVIFPLHGKRIFEERENRRKHQEMEEDRLVMISLECLNLGMPEVFSIN